MSKNFRSIATTVFGIAVFGLLMALPGLAEAGIYNANNEVTYKEYWINHSQFTGNCNEDGTPEKPYGNSFYFEPTTLAKCPKTLNFVLPDDFANAAKVEIFVDYWRNYNIQSSRFSLNGYNTVYAPPLGSDWSRTPYVGEIPISELNVGNNSITFWGTKPYHVHDVSFRIYYDDQHPLLAGDGSDVTPPSGTLDSIVDDNGPVNPNSGGSLSINGDSLTLNASVTGDAKYVEFHAWYEGYDEDNDGVFRDWHNVSRNNWWPGGTEVKDTGGVIDHVGTVKPNNGNASVTWDLTQIPNQAAIRFKIRVVDAAGNVTEAAGGDSADFRMVRNKAVLGFIIPGFQDAGLHMTGSRPDTAQYDFNLPSTITDFNAAAVIGAYWKNPSLSINGSNSSLANSGVDSWTLGVKTINSGYFVPGKNRIIYSWNNGAGAFIEKPGPMFVFRKSSAGGDSQPPAVTDRVPAPGAADVDSATPLNLNINDGLFGVDYTTVVLKVNGVDVSNKIKLDGVSSNYMLSYKPAQEWDYSTTFNVSVEACDLAGNCMSAVNYSFTTQAPDTTPPNITDVVVAPRPNGAKISWTTNESATSRIDYGTTAQYELGMVEDTALTTAHLLDIKNLLPATLYHFKITSTDAKGNSRVTPDDTFTTSIYPDVSSDDFNTCVLDPKWEYIDPIGDTSLFLNNQQAVITVPAGVAHDWTTGRPPRLMQLANDTDFKVDAKFESAIDAQIQMQGLLIEEDASTYVYVGYEYLTDTVTGLPTLSMYARFVNNGSPVKSVRKFLPGVSGQPLYARINRTGDSWEWYYSTDGMAWTKAAQAYTFEMDVLKAGVYAGNTASGGQVPGNTSIIDYFFNAASPIVPEDSILLTLNLAVNGNGTVEKAPDKTSYACGDEVAISVKDSPTGWFFESWSGDLESTNETETVIMDSPKSITANFAPIPYTLTVNLVNNGVGGTENKVTKDPDQATYVYDDVVNLTAVPQPGWLFKGWSGGLTGTELMKSVTMQQDVVTTATFEQIQYTLDLQIDNDGIGEGGTATATPSKATYLYGDVVALKATPKIGWTFTGWTGAVTSSDLETQLVVMNNSQVVAHFVQDQYDLNVTIVSDGIGEGGSVAANPQKTSYVYGEVVALIAEANPGWTFDGWGGALSGNNPVEVITIKGDTDVTATFSQDAYELEITLIGQGNVKVEPNKQIYFYGDKVKLTAIPAPNLFFGGWGGDLVGAQNPIEITITDDMAISALFTSNPPPVVDSIPNKTVGINTKVAFKVIATDPMGETLKLTVNGLPQGAKFTDNGDGTGNFEWTPGLSDRGVYEITFIAADSESVGSATTTITVSGYGIALPVVTNQQ